LRDVIHRCLVRGHGFARANLDADRLASCLGVGQVLRGYCPRSLAAIDVDERDDVLAGAKVNPGCDALLRPPLRIGPMAFTLSYWHGTDLPCPGRGRGSGARPL